VIDITCFQYNTAANKVILHFCWVQGWQPGLIGSLAFDGGSHKGHRENQFSELFSTVSPGTARHYSPRSEAEREGKCVRSVAKQS
jgi:hypothetical protein